MIQIMKASAGSGKTFNLARKYIELLLTSKDRYAYRHILAVTFTNKATDEMKSRIMKELFILADNPESSGYYDWFVPSVFPDRMALQEASYDIMCNILHDYSAFSVSTIDRFFQQTLKAFSREIGQFSSYQVELDKDSLVQESVDRILDALTENDKSRLKWLTDSTIERIEQGGKYSLESSLLEIATRLKSDEHRTMVERFGIDEEKACSEENLLNLKAICNKIIKDYEADVERAAASVIGNLRDAGVQAADFNRGFIVQVFENESLKKGRRVQCPKDTFIRKAADPESWFAQKKAKTLLPKVHPALMAPLQDYCDMFDGRYQLYNTAILIRAQLYGLGIAGDLYKEFDNLMKEKNVLSLDDSNTILKDIIDGSDAPFIYEKTGVRYDHFLLDEFQDTSRIQWENFLPLLRESEAKGVDSLVVGDVKQSIYRWRGSDWNLLAGELQKELHDTRVDTLDTNYRSARAIVGFNNGFFREVAARLDEIYAAAAGLEESRVVSGIYADVVQKCHSDREGSVSLTFCPKDRELEKVLDAVNNVLAHGASLKDIAVLVRNNDSGAAVARFLMENGIRVITDDSLKVRSSMIVRRLVALLSYVDNPSDEISSYMAATLGVSVPEEYHSLVDLCEHLLRGLNENDPKTIAADTLYIQSFLDCVSDYVRVNDNGLRGFLKHWEDIDPAISSPNAGDSVRIMTIHKSKGLDFPFVIFPFVETVSLFKSGKHWCVPEVSGTPLDGAEKGLYDVGLSSSSVNTLFAGDYREELIKQYVDNINVMYVALTRAGKGMQIIGDMPSRKFLENFEPGVWQPFSNFSQALYNYVCGLEGMTRTEDEDSVTFSTGELPSDWKTKTDAAAPETIAAHFPSWPINPENGRQRLVLNRSAADFFSQEGEAGVEASCRIKGIVLHDILSCVRQPGDIDTAVRQAVLDGNLDSEQAAEALALLRSRIASARERGWFREGALVRNEVDIIDADGSVHRPDRVEITPDGKVTVVDYKFGRPREEYRDQLARYADIYRRMGHGNVSAAVWYVVQDKVEEI